MANITCQKCGASWDTGDTATSHFFSSTTTYSQGDYTSPYAIAQSGEDMLTCPKGTQGALKDATEALGGGETQLEGRLKDLRETASQGNADVVHKD